MHPAPSVILFTTLSGLGFGLLFWLGFGFPGVTGMVAFVFFVIAYLLAVGGLLASTFHLGHPERALKAFSQWRTSWLSREAWVSLASLILMATYGAGLVFFETRVSILGWLGGLTSLATVFATSMIYTQLKTVPRWNTSLTPVLFLSISISGGALMAGQTDIAVWLLLAAGLVQLSYWFFGDQALLRSGSSLATATGLGEIGKLRSFEPPHTGTNYLSNEMVQIIGRKHALKLRIISLAFMTIFPVFFLVLPFSHAFAALAVLSHLIGVVVSRWLFFAQAEHVVGFYYGKR